MESDALMIATTAQMRYYSIEDSTAGGPSETSTLAPQSMRGKKTRGLVSSSMIVVLCGIIAFVLIPARTPLSFILDTWNIHRKLHLSIHVQKHSFLAASELIVVSPMRTPSSTKSSSSSTSTNSDANKTPDTTSSSSGRSIPLTPAADMPFPKWIRPTTNTTDTTMPLPFTKLGVVRTRPGQGSFFQYWFGHEVFPAIRKEQLQFRRSQQPQEGDGILAFALHTQQGQPDIFWVLQMFTSEEYYLNVYTPTIYNNNARLQKMRGFLLDEAPLLDLDLSGAPICIKGFPQLEERFDKLKTTDRDNLSQRNVQGKIEPTNPIDPQLRKHPSDNVTDPEQSTTTSNGNDNNTTAGSTPPAKNQGPMNTPPPAPYTVVMHLIIQPHKLVAFTEWFQSRLCHTIIQNGTKIINSVMYSIQNNQVWIYQTHRSQRDFLEYAEQLYSSGPAPALPLPWWSQQQDHAQSNNTATPSSVSTTSTTLSEELQSFLQKRVEFVALDPSYIRLGIHMTPDSQNGTKKTKNSRFSSFYSIHHPQ